MAKKKWFLDYFCSVVAKSVVKQCCQEMELTKLETRLVLERFCDKKGKCGTEDFYTSECQRHHLPLLDAKFQGWVERNLNKFKPTELVYMFEFMKNN